jgi:hypothetical protein
MASACKRLLSGNTAKPYGGLQAYLTCAAPRDAESFREVARLQKIINTQKAEIDFLRKRMGAEK